VPYRSIPSAVTGYLQNTSLSGRSFCLSTSVGWRLAKAFAPGLAQTSPLASSCVFELNRSVRKRITPRWNNIRGAVLHPSGSTCVPTNWTPIAWMAVQDKYIAAPGGVTKCPTAGCFRWSASTGWKPGGMGYEEYVPFEVLRNMTPASDFPGSATLLQAQTEPSLLDGSMDTYLSFACVSLEQHENPLGRAGPVPIKKPATATCHCGAIFAPVKHPGTSALSQPSAP